MTRDPARPVDDATLRALVREALRDVLPDLLAAVRAGGPVAARVEEVRVGDDAELAAFAARVLAAADDVRSGRLVFRLAAGTASTAATATAQSAPSAPSTGHRVDEGAVTERHVRAAEAAGGRLLLGPRAVLTPLARDRVRSSGVQVVRSQNPSSGPSPTPRRH